MTSLLPTLAIETISAGDGTGRAAGGMTVYFHGLISALRDDPDSPDLVVLQGSRNPLSLAPSERLRLVGCRGIPRNRFRRVAYEQTVLPAIAARAGAKVLLSTCNTVPLAWPRASVVVLQSLQYLEYPDVFGRVRATYLRKAVRASCRRADVVIAVSEWERSEACRLFELDRARVQVVYHGLSRDVARVASAGLGSQPFRLPDGRPYVLMVSTLYGFKNHRRLVTAFARIAKRRRSDHVLLLAGGDADVTARQLADHAASLGIGDRMRLLGPVDHTAVPSMLTGADAIAYPSLFETFGHPVIEALAFGKPLVTSESGATAEIAGGAAILVDPMDVDAIAAGLERALFDTKRRDEAAVLGPARAREFTWERCAQGTLDAVRLAVEVHG